MPIATDRRPCSALPEQALIRLFTSIEAHIGRPEIGPRNIAGDAPASGESRSRRTGRGECGCGLRGERTQRHRWLAGFVNGGQNALLVKPIPGRPPKVTAAEMRWLAQAVRDHTPLQFKFGFGGGRCR